MTDERHSTTGTDPESSARTGREHGGEVSEPASEIADKGRETAERARGKVQELAEEQRSSMVNRVSHVATACRVAADSLAEEEEDRLSQYAERAADQVDRVAGYIERKDVRSLVSDVRRIARRNPSAFLGGGFVAGLLLGRFLRSASPDRDPDGDWDRDWDREGYLSRRSTEPSSTYAESGMPARSGAPSTIGSSSPGHESGPGAPVETGRVRSERGGGV